MPNVQSLLADQGTTFTNGYISNSLCCPSRTSILTGKYSHGTDIYWNSAPHGGFQTFSKDHEENSTIATWLQSDGYYTGLVGKYLNGYKPKSVGHEPPGWDVWRALALPGSGDGDGGYYNYTMSVDGTGVQYGSAPSDYSTDVFANMAQSFIQGAPAGKPLFLYWAPRAPHKPSTPSNKYQNACSDLQPLRPPSYNEKDISDKPTWLQQVHKLSPTQMARIDLSHLNHCKSLLSVDDAVQTIVNALQNSGRLSNTMIVFASDNGIEFGEHRWPNKKVAYEESIRIPIIVRDDAIAGSAGRVDNHLVMNIDFAPTFAALAGVSAPGADGQSFLPLLSGTATSWRTDFLLEHWEPNNGRTLGYVPPYCGVHTEDAVYVEYQDGEQELYDLTNDPYELQNQANNPAYSGEVAQMHARMVQLCNPPPRASSRDAQPVSDTRENSIVCTRGGSAGDSATVTSTAPPLHVTRHVPRNAPDSLGGSTRTAVPHASRTSARAERRRSNDRSRNRLSAADATSASSSHDSYSASAVSRAAASAGAGCGIRGCRPPVAASASIARATAFHERAYVRLPNAMTPTP